MKKDSGFAPTFFFILEEYVLFIVDYSRKFVDGHILLNAVFFLVAEMCALFCR
jgi:hypothetical protein